MAAPTAAPSITLTPGTTAPTAAPPTPPIAASCATRGLFAHAPSMAVPPSARAIMDFCIARSPVSVELPEHAHAAAVATTVHVTGAATMIAAHRSAAATSLRHHRALDQPLQRALADGMSNPDAAAAKPNLRRVRI